MDPIVDELYELLENTEEPQNAWEPWVHKWATFSVKNFLRSTHKEIIVKLQAEGHSIKQLECLENLLPWPIDAIVGFETISYTVNLDGSLVDWLRDEMGQWWSENMYTFKEGLQMLPNAFAKIQAGWNGEEVDLSKNITFGVQAHEIKYCDSEIQPDHGPTKSVTVVCRNTVTKSLHEFHGDAVIVTLPMNIVRQMVFTPPLKPIMYKAIENISYSPSTKIMLQCKEQFWLRKDRPLIGGFSKTNLPIGQLHYPTNENYDTTDNQEALEKQRGVLMLYTWKREAMLFGSQSSESAIAEAVHEVSLIHPEIYKYFEVGVVQAWYNDPAAQGAFCFPKPEEYLAQRILYEPYGSLYFCGEALSTSSGWIQGALVSGLRSAYQFYKSNE